VGAMGSEGREWVRWASEQRRNEAATYRHADHVWLDTSLNLLLGRQLLVSRRRWVNDERLCVTDVGKVGRELDAVDERLGCVEPALATKAEHRAEAVLTEVPE
jgi:hypothetical protein